MVANHQCDLMWPREPICPLLRYCGGLRQPCDVLPAFEEQRCQPRSPPLGTTSLWGAQLPACMTYRYHRSLSASGPSCVLPSPPAWMSSSCPALEPYCFSSSWKKRDSDPCFLPCPSLPPRSLLNPPLCSWVVPQNVFPKTLETYLGVGRSEMVAPSWFSEELARRKPPFLCPGKCRFPSRFLWKRFTAEGRALLHQL